MIIGNKDFDLKNNAYIMGILNVTPDSFSDGGNFNSLDAALTHTEEMIKDGATIIDVGGESTRPGYTLISDEEEIQRVAPIIEAIKERFDVPVSLDTYKSHVAKAGIKAGADMINDIWGLKWDGTMADVVAKANVPICIMHNKREDVYRDFIEDMLKELSESVDMAIKAGIAKENIMLDPGVGFAKDYTENLMAINHVERLLELGYPVLLGTSRKSVVGLTLDLPKDERMEGTVATTVIGLMKGCSIFRVHDVKENYRAMKMTQAILSESKM